MENKLRRGLALLMTLIMLISCAPMDALAAIVPVSGGTQTSSGVSLKSIVKPPVATTTYVFMNGTEEFARQILKNGEALNNPGTPDSGSPNKEFTGWRDGDNNAPVFGAVTVTDTKTITYHAQFADVYFVFFTNEKGEVMVTKKGANGDTISTDGVTYPVGNEQSIVGWKDASGNLVSSVTLNGRDVTLTAKVENGHWITYDSQGGTYVAPAFVKGNGTTTAPAAPTRPGYTFRHWSAAVGGAAFTFGQPLDQALTLHAVWTANTDTRYTVIHWQENADDDEYSYAESETKTGATGAQTSAAAKSYTGFTVQTIAQQTIAGDGSTIVNVYYKRNTYTLTFRELTCERWHTHRDSCYKVRKTITAKYQADIHGNFPIKDGTETIWWTVPDNCQSFVSGNYLGSIDTMPAENITFSKKASESGAKLYYYVETLDGAAGDIAYNGKNYKLYKEIDLEYSTSTSLTYAEEFHPITGFTQGDSDPYLPVNGKVRMNRNNYLYYTRNSYNIVYVSGGEKVNTASKKFEQSIADAGSYTPPVKPVGQEDYVFGGWYADEATTKPYDFTGKTMPAQNVTVYAKWNKPVYNGTIYLTIEGTGSSIRINVPKGDTIETALNEKQAEIMAQVGEGYTWRGWRTGKDGTGEPFNPQTQITTDITLYPYYTKDGTFTVEYVSGKNDVTAPVDGKSYAEGSFADLMSPGALVSGDGEYFLGWSDGAATYQPRDKYQIKSNHAKENVITLTAQWGARPAGTTLTYKANGGAGADKVENLANNATVTTIANPFKRAGYTFAGWDTDASASTGSIGENEQVQVDSDGENILYAIWTANTDTKYTVEFYYQNTDGTYTLNHSDKRTATTDTEVSVTADDKAAKENNKYVFEADNKNNVLSGNVAGDGSLVLKLYFKLNTASYTIHHYLNGTTVKVAEDQTDTKTIGETLTANKSDALYPAYAAAVVAGYAPSQTITIAADESKNVITVYYAVPLTITANNNEKTYDGQPLTQPDFTMEGLVNGDTKENFTLSMTTESTITNAGSTPNVIDTDTVKYNGGAIPSYYNVSYNPGTLTVNKASATVTITGVNETAVYDGTQHEANGYNYSFTGKPNEITISLKPNVLAIARRTDVGTTTMGLTKDSFTVTSANYDVTIKAVIDGYVTITPVTDKVTVTVTENSDTAIYDGKEHSITGYESMTSSNELYDVTTSVEETETAAWTAKGINVGEYPVGIVAGDFTNTNPNFTNVEFKIVDGTLKINPITENTITITANSASKTYDGTPLTDGGFSFTEGVLVTGDVLTAVVEGSATNVGDEGKNVVKSYKVMRGDVDVTGNYTFGNSIDGKLTINKRTVTLTSETASKEYDGTPLTKPDVAVTGDGFVAGEVTDVKATGSVTFVHEGEVANTITYTEGADFKGTNYTISKKEGKLSITKREGEGKTITVTANSGEKVYDGAPLTNNSFTHAGALVEGDTLTAVVEGSQTDVGVGDNVVTSYVVMRGETDVTTSYTFADSVKGALTVTLRGVTFTGESKSLLYTGGMQSITGITQSGLVEGHRYEGLTYKAEGQNVGSYDGAFSGDVVIKDAQDNDVTKNYNVSKTPGKLTITNASFTVTFTGESDTKVYNGKEQSITGITVAGLKTGHRYENLTYAAKGTDKGEYKGAFTGTVKILDENNVDVTENYAVTKTPGKLTITAVETEVVVTIEGDKKAFTYDGTEHSAENYKVVRISNELYKEKDFTFTGTAEVKGTNANTYPMGLKEGDFRNDSKNFTNVKFIVTDGKLTINKRTVTLKSEGGSKEYDGTPLTKPEVAVTGDGFVAGEVTDVKATGSVTFVHEGEVTNAITFTRGEKFNEKNYDITYNTGKLKVTQNEKAITVTANSKSWEYDGQPHSDGGYTVEYDGQTYKVEAGGTATLPTGDVVTATVEGTVTNVADSADDNNVVTNVTITNKAGTVVNDQYETITRVNGGLKITRRGDSEDEDKKVKIIAEPNTVEYDGNAHGAKLVDDAIKLGTTYTTMRLVDGHYVDETTLDITGSQTNVGVYENELKPAVKAGNTEIVIRDKDDNDVTANYALTLVPATLTITGDKLIPDKKAEDENIESNYKLGDKIEFTITVKNVSIYDVENVIVTDANAEIQAGDGYTVSADKHTATIAIIAAKSEIRIKALHTVTSEDILAGRVGNVANVQWKDGETTVTKTVDDDTTKLTPPDVTLNVTKTSDWEGKATGAKPALGTKITYTITVKNTGNVPYANVNFTDLLQNGDATVTGEIPTYGTLAVNEEKSFTVEYIVTEADLLKESINNKVTAEADEIEYTYYEGETEKPGKATPNGEAEVTDRTDDAKASTISTKTTTSTPKNEKGYELGETITYDIVVTNDGNLTVTGIEVVDNLEGAEIKAGSGYDVVNGKAVIAELKPGESVTVKVEYVVTEADILAGKVVNDATVTGKGPGTDPEPDKPGTEDPTDTPKAELNIEKSVLNAYTDNTPFKLGEKIEYQLTITTPETNNVTVKDVKVTDTLLTKANEGKFEITSLPEGAAAAYDNDGKLIITMPNIDPGKHELVIKYTYTVQETDLGTVKDGKATLGTVHNAATVAGTTDDPKVIPGSEDGNDVSTVAKLTITANDNSHVYDGKSHGARLNDNGQIEQNVSYTLDAELLDGHKIESVGIPFTAILVGVYDSEKTGWLMPQNARITADGEDVTSKYYEITYVPGALTITASTKELKIVANSTTWTYNGEQHTDGGYTVTYGEESYTVKAGESATLSTGDKVTAVVKGQVKDVDDTKAGNNEIVEWSVEHRDFYNNVTPANGTLTITPRKVTLESDGGSKKYDGTPLTRPDVTIEGSFVEGEVSDIKATGSVTYVSEGEVDNLITFKKNEGFKDSNYGIEEKIGKLFIEPLDVTIIITGPSAIRGYEPGVTHTIVTGGSELDFVYDSDKVDGKIGVEGMVKGDKILPGTLKHTLEGMYVGEYEGVFTLFDSNGKKADKPTVMHDGVDVTENYKFSYKPGTLTITGDHMDGDKKVENEIPEKNYLLGQKIPFTITVRSVSKDELTGVTVTDPTATILPDRNTANPAYTVSEDGHTATITSIAPEAEVIVYAEHEVTEDDIINRYTNEATINWGDDVVEVSKTPSIEEKNPEAELVKEIVLQDGQDENHKFKLGETVYFKITVTNTGNVTLKDYEVKEALPGAAFIEGMGTGYTLNADKTVATIEKMEPVKDGQEAPDSNQIVLYAQYTIKEEDLGNKELKNIVTADNSKPGEVPIPVDEAKSVSGQKIWKDEGNAFNTRPASITLTLMRKLGQNGAAEQYRTMQLGSNGSWRYSFDHLPKHDAQENEYFYWVVEEPVTGYDTAYETKDESHCDIVNNLQTYTLTIHYWQHKLGDTKMEQAFPDYVATLYYKQPYDVESPEREGIILDDMSQARISGTMPVHDLVIDVYYHRIAYRLTIHYIYQDGTMAHEDYTWTYWFNSTYNVPSPIIPGFTPSIDVIAGRMPSHGLELTVVYVGDGEIVVPDEDTSLGFKSYLNAGECFE